MSRIKVLLPENYIFTTEIPVRITDLNYGGHLGNDSLLSIVHEARMRFLKNFNYTELNIEGKALLMVDALINFIRESFHGDVLKIEINISNIDDKGFDMFYKITNKETGKLVAAVKTGMVFFDYEKKKLSNTPEKFKSFITNLNNQG